MAEPKEKSDLFNELVDEMLDDQQRLDALNMQLSRLMENINLLKMEIVDVETRIEGRKNIVNEIMIVNEEHHYKNMVFRKFEKPNVGYTDEKKLLEYLKEKQYSQYIKTKVTESLDKNPLKKALKSNEDLKMELAQFINEGTTSYTIFTSEENYAKMLEHIEEGKN